MVQSTFLRRSLLLASFLALVLALLLSQPRYLTHIRPYIPSQLHPYLPYAPPADAPKRPELFTKFIECTRVDTALVAAKHIGQVNS